MFYAPLPEDEDTRLIVATGAYLCIAYHAACGYILARIASLSDEKP